MIFHLKLCFFKKNFYLSHTIVHVNWPKNRILKNQRGCGICVGKTIAFRFLFIGDVVFIFPSHPTCKLHFSIKEELRTKYRTQNAEEFRPVPLHSTPQTPRKFSLNVVSTSLDFIRHIEEANLLHSTLVKHLEFRGNSEASANS